MCECREETPSNPFGASSFHNPHRQHATHTLTLPSTQNADRSQMVWFTTIKIASKMAQLNYSKMSWRIPFRFIIAVHFISAWAQREQSTPKTRANLSLRFSFNALLSNKKSDGMKTSHALCLKLNINNVKIVQRPFAVYSAGWIIKHRKKLRTFALIFFFCRCCCWYGMESDILVFVGTTKMHSPFRIWLRRIIKSLSTAITVFASCFRGLALVIDVRCVFCVHHNAETDCNDIFNVRR